jgi:23S rRNA (guanine2445-N2)-methyltransferase / 23S rRNA (guanine2069-N7)-methyltransferase
MDSAQHFFATAAKGMEELLAAELRELGAGEVEQTRAGVGFTGKLEVAYRACLWSRTASRVLLPLARFPASTPELLYKGVQGIDWGAHIAPEGTLAVDFASSESQITHTHFGALKVKDAIVDQLRDRTGRRPSVDTHRPDLRVNVHVKRDEATVSIDLSGESLHRRSYRVRGAPAPLKESLAAAILLLAEWPRIVRDGGGLVDPMCGTGTLPIEAALIACDVAPGLLRREHGFERWPGHDAATWKRLVEEAKGRDRRGKAELPPIVGYDVDPEAVRAATECARRAGVATHVAFERRELAACEPVGSKPGLFVVNPPYGERLGEISRLGTLYRRIGDTLKQRFKGWSGFVFTGNLELAKSIGLHVTRRHVLYNGPIECRLLAIPIEPPKPEDLLAAKERPRSEGAQAFANRLHKDFKHLSKWARREGVTCFRVYDADIPEYALAVDFYERWVHVQEYEPPATVDPSRAEARLHEALAEIPEVLGVRASDVFLKVRRKQRGSSQYERLDALGEMHEVGEGGLRFLVNFTDYLDTGLFLDHRQTRQMIRELAKGKDFLNLFGYTGSATVYAASGGASSTTTVDLSNTYLDWAWRNLELNGFANKRNQLVRANVLRWIGEERRRYGLIFLDPPTFSTSKAMEETWDVQRDYAELLREVSQLLAPGGTLIFSNNFRKFRMDAGSLPELEIEEITRATIPPDYAGNPRIHNCWRVRRR